MRKQHSEEWMRGRIRTDKDRKRATESGKSRARKVTHVRATAQKHNSELCFPLLWSYWRQRRRRRRRWRRRRWCCFSLRKSLRRNGSRDSSRYCQAVRRYEQSATGNSGAQQRSQIQMSREHRSRYLLLVLVEYIDLFMERKQRHRGGMNVVVYAR